MAVGNVVYDLAHRPSAGTVGRVELSLGEPLDRRAQVRRCAGDLVERGLFLLIGEWSFEVKLADSPASAPWADLLSRTD